MGEDFDKCARAYERSQAEPVGKKREQHQLYGLYKQARVGDINVDQPGFFNFEDRAKYQAWKDKKGMPADRAKARFVELARKMGYRDPGDSPVPWISDETWRRENSWGVPDYEAEHPAVDGARPMLAVDFDRQIAPKIATSDNGQLAPTGSLEEQKERLDSPPASRALRIYSPIWPVCCNRLSTLVGHDGVDEVFEAVIEQTHHLRAEVVADWDVDPENEPHKVEGLVKRTYDDDQLQPGKGLYHCANCGSVYVATCEA